MDINNPLPPSNGGGMGGGDTMNMNNDNNNNNNGGDAAGNGTDNGGGSNQAVIDNLKQMGKQISDEARRQGLNITPVLASFACSLLTLNENDPVSFAQALTPHQEQEVARKVVQKIITPDDPLFETLKMQVSFESLYASELNRLRSQQYQKDTKNRCAVYQYMHSLSACLTSCVYVYV